jgi:polyisoprenoid-binding protein YceI
MSAPIADTAPTDIGQPAGDTKRIAYRIDPKQSRFTVQAFAEGLFSAFGHDPRFNAGDVGGEVRMEEGNLASAALDLSVKAASLRVTDDVSEKDRLEMERMMHDEVLESSRYPEIIFKGQAAAVDRIYEGFYRVKITGQLSLHGTTREHAIDTQVRVMDNGLRAEGETQLRQTNWGIKRVSVAGGTLKVKDEVKLSFNIVATAES